ncbi:hypothetical protein AB0I60_11355 [Actinosynnema sp. NPDC050436]|uniref:hypothetical protein n=1 Tax=Actinosynnema sp. NPDC050436 TaxID=3155659 RepID=UPI0033D2B586
MGDGVVDVVGVGRGPNIGWRLVSLAFALAGPITAWFGYAEDGLWSAQMVVGSVLALLLTPLGIGVWRGTTRTRRRLLRLDEVGLPATAEILSARGDGGEVEHVEMVLLISGPDVPPFRAEYRCAMDSGFRRGRLLTAVVDPDDGTFLIREVEDGNWVPPTD